MTVSKALSDSPDISAETRRKVKQTAQDKGYIPNHAARTLHKHRTYTLGVVVPDVSNSFFSLAVNGIADAASKNGYKVMLTISRENADIERENITTLLAHRVDGLLIAISQETSDTKIFESVRRMGIPLVFFDRSMDGVNFSSVGLDDRRAAFELVGYAIACGYRKIAHLAGSSRISVGRERSQGYVEALKAHNIAVRGDWIIEGGFDKAAGYHGFNQLRANGGLPEAVFTANDKIAQGAYRAIREAGLRIPDDIGVFGFGHHEFAELLSPPLTIADFSPDVLGSKATELLLHEIDNGARKEPLHIVLPTSLKVNSSIRIK